MSRTKDPDFTILMSAMSTACKLVARSVRKAGIAGLYGAAGSENATGDDQKKLDVLSNDMFVNALYNSHVCAVLVSEEDDDGIIVPPELAGKYCVALILLMVPQTLIAMFPQELFLVFLKKSPLVLQQSMIFFVLEMK